jgi:hypothetical protein
MYINADINIWDQYNNKILSTFQNPILIITYTLHTYTITHYII